MAWNKKQLQRYWLYLLKFVFSLSLLYKEINLEFTVLATLLYSQYENTIFKHSMKRHKMYPKTTDKNTPKLALDYGRRLETAKEKTNWKNLIKWKSNFIMVWWKNSQKTVRVWFQIY